MINQLLLYLLWLVIVLLSLALIYFIAFIVQEVIKIYIYISDTYRDRSPKAKESKRSAKAGRKLHYMCSMNQYNDFSKLIPAKHYPSGDMISVYLTEESYKVITGTAIKQEAK